MKDAEKELADESLTVAGVTQVARDRRESRLGTSANHSDTLRSASETQWVIDLLRRKRRGVEEPGLGPVAGTLIGGVYRVIETIAAGGMGVVVLAQDESLDRSVAIKFILPHLLNGAMRERFTAEARAMARVKHPNVVQIHAFGEHDGAPYFVMEVIEGQTLEQWLLARGSVPDLDIAFSLLDGICRGVEAIHAADTMHRDIKPSNILLDAKLEPHIADLGVSVLCPRDRRSKPEAVGTPHYMAPEIALQHDLDPALRGRADVYSLGCLAYQLITGQLPFDGRGQLGVIVQQAVASVPPPSSRRGDLPPALDAVILRALAKEPSERTHSAEALRGELGAARRGSQEPVRILLAEDDDDFREALAECLGAAFPGADVEAYSDGESLLDAFDRRWPSVVISDLRMPRLDGMALTALLRKREPEATIPIIILTASGGPEEWRRLAAIGADRFLVKPVVLDDVVALVRTSLEERARSRSAPSSA